MREGRPTSLVDAEAPVIPREHSHHKPVSNSAIQMEAFTL